ncbi:MAG: hypothetical protein HKN26_15015 [Acidimicrobiales bacterium]|nr:hypothetical protein [Acidimicrobiales bacterium]
MTVHLAEADAIESFAYNVESLSVCNGALRTDADGVVRFDITPTDVQFVGDVDDSGAAFYRGTDADAAAELLLLYARRGNVTVATFGSEAPTTIYLQELMLSRLSNTAPPERVEPQGEIEVGPGDPSLAAAPTEPSAEGPPDVAVEVRDLADQILEGDPLAFVENSSDAELTELADRTCTTLTGADPDDSTLLDRLFAELWEESDPTVRDQLNPFDFGQVLGVLMGVSCPETLDLLS